MRRRLAGALAAVGLGSGTLGAAVAHREVVVLTDPRPAGAPGSLAWRVDANRQLVYTGHDWLLVNWGERAVLRVAPFGWRWHRLVLWPRGSLKGVVLGDAVKGDAEEAFRFGHGRVAIDDRAAGQGLEVARR